VKQASTNTIGGGSGNIKQAPVKQASTNTIGGGSGNIKQAPVKQASTTAFKQSNASGKPQATTANLPKAKSNSSPTGDTPNIWEAFFEPKQQATTHTTGKPGSAPAKAQQQNAKAPTAAPAPQQQQQSRISSAPTNTKTQTTVAPKSKSGSTKAYLNLSQFKRSHIMNEKSEGSNYITLTLARDAMDQYVETAQKQGKWAKAHKKGGKYMNF
jgi:hypothetical protein